MELQQKAAFTNSKPSLRKIILLSILLTNLLSQNIIIQAEPHPQQATETKQTATNQNKDIYKCQNEQNNSILFTDNPQNHKNCVKKTFEPIKTIQTQSPNQTKESAINTIKNNLDPKSNKDKSEAPEYTVFKLVLPPEAETGINQGGGLLTLPVSFQLEPNLDQNDKLQVLFDGAPYGPPSINTTVTINKENLDPGQHSVTGNIIRDNQIIKTSNTGSFAFTRNHLPLHK